VTLAGDGRYDSPRASAKFCTYSLMDTDNNTIIQSVTVDKRQVLLQSPNMERKAVSSVLTFVKDQGIIIDKLVTDASSAIQVL